MMYYEGDSCNPSGYLPFLVHSSKEERDRQDEICIDLRGKL